MYIEESANKGIWAYIDCIIVCVTVSEIVLLLFKYRTLLSVLNSDSL